MIRRVLSLTLAALGGSLVLVSLVLFGAGYLPLAAESTPLPQATAGEPAPEPTPSWTSTPGPVIDTTRELIAPTIADIPATFSADERADAIEWLETKAITTACMAEKGFDFVPHASWFAEGAAAGEWMRGFSQAERDAARLALHGDTGAGADYHWEDAGCVGLAVHEMGNDNAH